jgi:hypothetical protein
MIMDKRMTRFKHCDSRFYPYLKKVLERLPGEVKEDVLNNEALQIVSHEDFHEMCILGYEFDHPFKKLVYLNTRVLTGPEHGMICTVAHAIAYSIVGEKERGQQEKEAEELLLDWGFEQELEAVRYCRAVFESADYKKGYEWAIKQNKDYLLQHFGLYFDEWNEKGLGRMSRKEFDRLYDEADVPSSLIHMPQIKKQRDVTVGEDRFSDVFSSDEAVLSGVMAAVKEVKRA